MADNRRYAPVQSLSLEQILQEAQLRWLRPVEICEVLRNHQKFHLTSEPPDRPPAGSLFLFDRKVLRYFRKDGHSWRKKKDGKTVKEAHEKLKAGSVDVLHCYYAHGEDNENFQRRSYWMLDEELDNVVLVHYREVKEGSKLCVSRLLKADPGSQLRSSQTSSSPCLEQKNSPILSVQMSNASNPNAVDWNEQSLSSEFQDRDYGEDPGTSSLARPIHGSVSHNASLLADPATGYLELSKGLLDPASVGAVFHHEAGSSMWTDMHGSSGNLHSVHGQKFYFQQLNAADFLTHKLIDAKLDANNTVQDFVSCGNMLIPDGQIVAQAKIPYAAKVDSQVGRASNDEAGELKKLDSFGRWMDKNIGGDCDDSLMASDSGNYWNTLDTENDKEVSSLSHHMQLSIDELGPSVILQEQLFTICDFAPDWAYSGVETKVLITGTFLGDKKHSGSFKWCCMFGEIEVSAEVLTDNVMRCQVPFHAPGRVPLYITCSNRLACSEVREFEYCERSPEAASSVIVKTAPKDEVLFQVRLTKMLDVGSERKWLDCSVVGCDKCKLKKNINSLKTKSKIQSKMIENDIVFFEGYNVSLANSLIQNLLKGTLYEWLICKVHEGGKGPHILDNEGQGVIHLAAALGFEWAMCPIVASGVSPNFRDVQGRTALHWASYYGREETVVALVRLGAAAGAVDDPTSASPGGQTASDLASGRGHKGIAGYLAEADLTSHLSSLTLGENSMESAAATIAAEKATDTAAQNVLSPGMDVNEEHSLRGSLAAVRKSAHAAALIQDAFRARSFRHRQQTKSNSEISGTSLDLVTLGLLNKVQKVSHFEDYLHSAAIKIQQKYRGWKGRRQFLKIRKRIVKIQAHVRGHQVRKQYKKVVWSVSIVEKAILRWRRKRHGLRGFQMVKTNENAVPETEKCDEYEFLRIGRRQKIAGVEKALARVQSMVRHPEARDQYMRLVKKYEDSKLSNEAVSASGHVPVTEER
ncbi:Calmodulin-binding transcription activator 3 like [Actinidia chinensis var. chinensis]|uniref:Calmodulin-binding transcription activator 3 like n=1 Tax=Actinidia chinensis var. chinensis TaxID=1590841 RepID=A0A2R6PVW8_ACTCC|nr:Calmodulin-binding transcription activator 3 like [Actinidia chinensis var. chinensis]